MCIRDRVFTKRQKNRFLGLPSGRPYESAEKASIAIKGVQLSNGETYTYREHGTGKQVLLLVHGNLSSSILWDLLLEGLPAGRYRMLAPDLRGFGDSSYHSPIQSIADLSQDLLAFMDALHVQQAAVMGWSMGGLVALQAAAAFSPEDEPALEMTLAAPRPISWLIVERLTAIALTY